MTVRTLGLICARASTRTMASNRTPQARPTPLVQLISPSSFLAGSLRFRFRAELGEVVDGRELEDFHFAISVGRDDRGAVAHFFVEEGAADRRVGGNFSFRNVGFFGGH